MNKYKKKIKIASILLIIGIITFLGVRSSILTYINTPDFEDYSVFENHLENNEVDVVYYPTSGDEFRYVLFNDETREMSIQERSKYSYPKNEYHRSYYPSDDETFKSDLVKRGVRVEQNNFKPPIVSLGVAFFGLIFYIVIVGLLVTIILKSTESIDIEVDYKNTVRFKDVIGHDEVIDDIKFYADLLSGSIKDKTVKVPKGLLLTGPPGTGKTLIAKAIAGEVGCTFFSVNSSEIIDMFVGKGAKNIRNAFKQARKHAPAILFIDEIDAIGGKRNTTVQSTNEDRQTLNALLQEMDGFNTKSGIFVIAATNDPESLDPALKRAGRFDREIKILAPMDDNVIKDLYDHFLKGKKVAYDLDISGIVKNSRGLTGADIQAICNEAALINLYKKADGITSAMLFEAFEKFILKGNVSKRVVGPEENKLVRYHESGHAVMHYLKGVSFQKITVIPNTSGAGGYVLQDTPYKLTEITKKTYEASMCISYAGRAAEAIKFGNENVTLGAVSDISDVTDKIRDYVGKYGFTDNKSYLDLSKFRDSDELMLTLSKGVASRIFTETEELLRENFYLVEALAEALIEKPTIEGKDAVKLLDDAKEAHEKEIAESNKIKEDEERRAKEKAQAEEEKRKNDAEKSREKRLQKREKRHAEENATTEAISNLIDEITSENPALKKK